MTVATIPRVICDLCADDTDAERFRIIGPDDQVELDLCPEHQATTTITEALRIGHLPHVGAGRRRQFQVVDPARIPVEKD